MDINDIVSLLFGSGVLLSFSKHVLSRIKKIDDKNEAVCLGVQALLRDHLISSYNHWSELGYAPLFAKENFENMWKQYHSLGENGVMDSYHVNFMDLPDFPQKEEE